MQNQTVIEKQFPDIQEKLNKASEKLLLSVKMEDDYRNFMRDAMYDLRSRLGVTAKSFGLMIGVSKGYVYLLEKCQRPWSPKLLAKLNEKLESM